MPSDRVIYTPKEHPRVHGFKYGDTHMIVNAVVKTVKAYAFNGSLLWEVPALADGQHPNWRAYQGDTPPGLYRLGALYDDYGELGNNPEKNRTLLSYGWQTYEMIDLEGNDQGVYRPGICLHGGGTGLGWPGAWLPKQMLVPTWGCVRMHNQDLVEKVHPRYKEGDVFLSVYQDDR